MKPLKTIAASGSQGLRRSQVQKKLLLLLFVCLLLGIAGQTQAADPTSISGLLYWGRANNSASWTRATGGRCSALADSSGNGYNATQATSGNQPALIDGPNSALAFESGGNQYLSLPSGVSLSYQSLSIFMVWDFDLQPSSSAGNTQLYQILFGSGGTSPLFVSGNTGTYGASKNQLMTNITGATPAISNLKVSTGRHFVGVVTTSTSVTFYLDNQSQTITLAPAVATGQTGWTIGSYGGGTFWAYSNLLDCAVYNTSLTAAQVSTLYTYEQSCNNITPASATTANVVCVGTSITVGIGASSNMNWVRQLKLNPGVQVFGRGTSSIHYGDTGSTGTLVGMAALEVDSLYDSSKTNILVLDAPTNDIGYDSITASQAYTRIANYITSRMAAGWKNFVVQTMLPRNVSESIRTAFNTLLRAMPGTIAGATIVVADCGGDAVMGPASAYADPTLYSDGTHPSARGNNIMAGIITTAVNTFLPQSLGGTLQVQTVKGGL